MKRSILIISGIILILALAGVWVYLLFFNTGEEGGLFGGLDFTPEDDPNIQVETSVPSGNESDVDEVAIDESALQQLTTRPVIGYRFIGSNNQTVIYAEEGTGHIYEIDMVTRQERRVSQTTIPEAYEAVFSASGTEAVILSGDAEQGAVLGEIDAAGERMEVRAIPASVTNLTSGEGDEIMFVDQEAERAVGRVLNIATLNERVLFTVPFTAVKVAWGRTAEDRHYVYPKATADLPGYLYQASAEGLGYTGQDGYGLSAIVSGATAVVSKTENDSYRSMVAEFANGTTRPSPITTLPEKCVFSPTDGSILFCGSDITGSEDATLPDDWYSGQHTSNDSLWKISLRTNSAELLTNPKRESGRQIDIIHPASNDTGTQLLFSNKLDNTLWLFNL